MKRTDRQDEKFIASQNSRRFAWFTQKGGGGVFIIDGKPQTKYQIVFPDSVRFSQDSTNLVYSVKKNDKQLVIINGKEGPVFDEIAPLSMLFSPDSKHLAYAARIDQKWSIILDGRVCQLHDEIGAHRWVAEMGYVGKGFQPTFQQNITNWTMKFSPDSNQFAYLVRDGDLWAFVLDQAVHQSYEIINPEYFVFSPDSNHFVYKVEHRGKSFLVVDGEEQEKYDLLLYGSPVFSPDSKRLGYFAQRNGIWFAVIDGIENQVSGTPVKRSIKFSPDSKHVAYATWINDQEWYWKVDGIKHNIYKAFGLATFSPDSKSFIYTGIKRNRGYLVIDGQTGKSNFSRVGPFRLSPDGEHLAYTATVKSWGKDRKHMVLDGIRGDAYDSILGQALFSPDSQHIAYRAKKEKKWLVVVDEEPGKRYQSVFGLTFSPDSNHLAYVGKQGNKDVLVVDHRELNRHEKIYASNTEYVKTIGSIIFDTPTQLHYLAQDKGEISLHEINLVS
ncbi:hypothetical protein ACFLYP_03065 [Chloroflexota bacterium]